MPKVLLTRPNIRVSKNDEIHRILSHAGVAIQELPMLNFELPRDTETLDAAIVRAARGEFDFIILSSPTAVNFLEDQAKEITQMHLLVEHGRFGGIGQATTDELTHAGFNVVLPIPASGGAHQLTALLAERGVAGKRILLLQSQLGLDILEHSLGELGATIERVTLYYTKGPTLGDSARLLHMLEGDAKPDVIAFFSPSSVQYFIRSLAEMASGMLRHLPPLACIGETTAKAVEEGLHRRPEIVARKADQASLAFDILSYLGLGNLN